MNQNSSSPVYTFLEMCYQSVIANDFVKLSLADYHGEEKDLKKCIIKIVLIKRAKKWQIVYRYATKDITKNYTIEEGQELLKQNLETATFRIANLSTLEYTYHLQCHGKHWKMKKIRQVQALLPSLQHDHVKRRAIDNLSQAYLYHLGLTNAHGQVIKSAQDKYKQINHYIELLAPSLAKLKSEAIHIADMGAGKGYLTFALYDYLHQSMKLNAKIVGIEYRVDLVNLCNDIAKQSNFEQLHFVEGTIESYAPENNLDVLIALHACDTATDDAIFKGISYQAPIIVTAPCCHKEVRKEMSNAKAEHPLQFMTKYGIFMERQAEMITDSLRAMLLEYCGYQVKVIQFISDAHTPKNVMIIAEKLKNGIDLKKKEALHQDILSVMHTYGIQQQHLCSLLGLDK